MDDEAMKPEEPPSRGGWEIEEVSEDEIRQLSEDQKKFHADAEPGVGDEDWVAGLGEEVDE